MVDVQLFGMRPGAHHLTSVLLHTASTVLLFLFLYRTTGLAGPSAFAAALFASHPLHVESVAWIAERKDVLSGFFWVLTLLFYAAYVRQPRLNRYLALLAAFALGLMSKPVLVTLPFALLLLDFWPLRRIAPGRFFADAQRLIVEKLPLFALAAASSVATFLVQRQGGAVIRLDQVPLALRASNAAWSYIAYILDVLWPARLAVFYPLDRALSPVWAACAILLLAGGSAAVIRLAKRHAYFPVGWFWYLGTLVPMIGLVQVGNQSRADRYAYIPTIGLFVIAAWGGRDLMLRRPSLGKALPIAAGFLVLGCAVAAGVQLKHWKGSPELWSRALDVTTGNYAAHNALGLIRSKEGKPDEAIAHYNEALRAKPDYVESMNNLGIALAAQRRFPEAIAQYSKAIGLAPRFSEPHTNLASTLAVLGKTEEAIAELNEALRIEPGNSRARNNLGFALLGQGKLDEAMAHLSEAVRIEPTFPNPHYGLALALEKQGNIEGAMRECGEALRIDPEYRDARNKLEELKRGRQN
jgi:Flp pilus assembly protein TadD